MPARRRAMLLSASFAHIDSPRLRPVAIAALEHSSELTDDIIAALTGPRKELLAELPLRVRQRVWETEDPPQLFLAETHSLIVELTNQCRTRFDRAAERSAAEVPPRQRRAESKALIANSTSARLSLGYSDGGTPVGASPAGPITVVPAASVVGLADSVGP